ncbi:MAG: SET domain-containing protein [Candidatus Liptonbacteria bacterium]|nr:SET domain-containing protein [Candidatus Liptonbacteria bacterium]
MVNKLEVSSYLSPKTKSEKSSVEGQGLFAIKAVKKGEIVAIKGGYIVDGKTLKKFESIIGDSELQVAENFFLAPLQKSEKRKVMMFLNHSCNPNVGVQGNIVFVAIRDIRPKEELTIDYAMIDDVSYRMKCSCHGKNCRRFITGKDWKNKKLQKKYKGYFSAFIAAKIKT